MPAGWDVARWNGSTFEILRTVPFGTNSWTDTDLQPGTQYLYRIQGRGKRGVGAWSNTVSATTLPIFPSVPAGLDAFARTASYIQVSWNSAAHADGYILERKSGTSPFGELARTTAPVTQYLDRALSVNTEYVYRVRAYNAAGVSQPSVTDTESSWATRPAAPSNLSAAPSGTEIALNWEDNSGGTTQEDGFHVWRKSATESAFVVVATVGRNTTTYQDAAGATGSHYTYVVQAFNRSGVSPSSNKASATAP
jgi:titin